MHYLTGVLLCVRYSAVLRTFVVNETTPSAPFDGLAAFMARTPDIGAPRTLNGVTYKTFNKAYCDVYCSLDNNWWDTKCDLCTTQLQVHRNSFNNTIPLVMGSADLQRRYISIPNFVGCGSAYACTAGPCTVIDYHYLSEMSVHARTAALELEGNAVCGPIFGIQARHQKTEAVIPDFISVATSTALPSKTITKRILWEGGKEDQVPVVPQSAHNYNPGWYYKNKEAHHAGSTESKDLTDKNCELRTDAPDIPPTFWSLRGAYNGITKLGAGPWLDFTKGNISNPGNAADYLNQCRESDTDNTECQLYYKNLIYQWNLSSDIYDGSATAPNQCDLTQCVWSFKMDSSRKRAHEVFAVEAFFYSMILAAESYFEKMDNGDPWSVDTLANYGILTSLKLPDFQSGWRINRPFSRFWNNEHITDPNGDTSGLPAFSCSHNRDNHQLTNLMVKAKRDCYTQTQAENNDMDYSDEFPNFGLSLCLMKKDPHGIYWTEFKVKNAPYDMAVQSSHPKRSSASGWYDVNPSVPDGDTLSTLLFDLSFISGNSVSDLATPLPWAVDNNVEWIPNNMQENASFANRQGVTESASCDCGNIPIRYAVLEIPWDRTDKTFYNEWVKAKPDDEKNPATVLTEMSYGWETAVGDFRSELPVGLYVPSNPRFDVNFTVHERDFLRTPKGVASEALLTKYYTGDGAPNKAALTELLFNTTRSSNFMQTKTVFKYGSCMRWPYGVIGRMEMSTALHNEYFPTCTIDKDCSINEESLIGYCEGVPVAEGNNKLYTYCANDPLTIEKRREVCAQPRAQYVVVGPTLGIRQPNNICSSQHKTCLIIPGEASYALNTVLNSNRFPDLTNYDILISPFNWSVANGMMGPNRTKYLVHSKPRLEPFDDNDQTLTGMAALSSFEFNTFLSPGSVDDIHAAMVGIVAKLNASQKADGTFDLPFLYDIPDITRAAIFPPLRIGHVHVMHKDITVQSALPAYPLNLIGDGTDNTCELFLIASTGFKLLGAIIDQEACNNVQSDLRKCPLVFGGADVSGAYIEAAISNAPLAAAFVGHYTSRFPFVEEVCAYDVTLNITQTAGAYSVAAARAYGTIDIPGGADYPAIIQPLWNETINITGPQHTINVSQFTRIFGKQIMRTEYPRLIPHQSLHWMLFGVLVAVNIFAIIVLLRRAFRPTVPK